MRGMTNTAALKMKVPHKYNPERNYAEVVITNIKTLKRRPKSSDPCDEDLYDDDRRWIQETINHLGCLPVFWKNVSLNFNNDAKHKFCTKYRQYEDALNYVQNIMTIARKYKSSCTSTTTLSYSKIGSANKKGVMGWDYESKGPIETNPFTGVSMLAGR